MRARTNFMVDAGIMAGYAIATNPMATGTPVHEWLGIGVALVAFVHLVAHWDWATSAVRRFFGHLNVASRINLTVDLGLLVAGVATALSGLIVSRAAMRVFGYTAPEAGVWPRIHSESATVLLVLVGLHLGLHWDWLAAMWRQHVLKPLRSRRTSTARAATVGRGRSGTRVAVVPTLTRTAAALLLTAAVAGGVWTIAPRAEAALGWLVLPGESRTVEQAAADTVASETATTAANFEGTEVERIAVRVSHSLLIVVIATLVGSALHDLTRKH